MYVCVCMYVCVEKQIVVLEAWDGSIQHNNKALPT